MRLARTSVTYDALSTTSLRCCFPFFPPLRGRGVAGAAVFLDPCSSCRGRAEGGEESSPVVRARGCVTVTERPRGVLGVLRWCVLFGAVAVAVFVRRSSTSSDSRAGALSSSSAVLMLAFMLLLVLLLLLILSMAAAVLECGVGSPGGRPIKLSMSRSGAVPPDGAVESSANCTVRDGTVVNCTVREGAVGSWLLIGTVREGPVVSTSTDREALRGGGGRGTNRGGPFGPLWVGPFGVTVGLVAAGASLSPPCGPAGADRGVAGAGFLPGNVEGMFFSTGCLLRV